MKVEFTYCGIDVDFTLENADDSEVNPVPILEAIIKVFNSISYYRSVKLELKSQDWKVEE
jgi:hypothetical protein